MSLVLAFAALALACASQPVPSGWLHSETTTGPFELTLDIPSETWAAGQPIIGQARLELAQGDAMELGGSGGGVLGFNYTEVGGRRHLDAIWTADCATHHLGADAPLTTALDKSGGFSLDDPDADFYRAFLTAPYVALPAGSWDITAVAHFADGPGCSGGNSFDIRTTVRLMVTQ